MAKAKTPATPTPDAAPPPADNAQLRALLATPVTDRQIQNWFEHHNPNDEDVERIKRVRAALMAAAQVVRDNTPGGPDQAAAIRKLREALMTANAAIVCRGR